MIDAAELLVGVVLDEVPLERSMEDADYDLRHSSKSESMSPSSSDFFTLNSMVSLC